MADELKSMLTKVLSNGGKKKFFFAYGTGKRNDGKGEGELAVSGKKPKKSEIESALANCKDLFEGVCWTGDGPENSDTIYFQGRGKKLSPIIVTKMTLTAKTTVGRHYRFDLPSADEEARVASLADGEGAEVQDAPAVTTSTAADQKERAADPLEAAYLARVKLLTEALKKAITSGAPAGNEAKLRFSKSQDTFRKGDFSQAMALLHQTEEQIKLALAATGAKRAEATTQSGVPNNLAEQWKKKLAAWTPLLKEKLAAKGPHASEIAKLLAEAVALAKPGGDLAQALTKLTECHALATAPDPQTQAETNGESAGTVGAVNEYGEGYQAFDLRNVHSTLADALKESPPRMLTADEWRSIADSPQDQSAKQKALKKWDLAKGMAADPALFTKLSGKGNGDEATRRVKQLETLLEMKDDFKLSGPLQKDIESWKNYWAAIAKKPLQALFTPEPKLIGGNAVKEFQNGLEPSLSINTDEKRAEYAALLDAPENNQERGAVATALAELETTETLYNAEWERIAQAYEAIPATDREGRARAEAMRVTGRKDFLKEKCIKLHELERTLFAWNDRRTRENLPPSAEAIAMADILQAQHREVIEEVADNSWPLRVADGATLSPDEYAKLQDTWKSLVEQKGKVVVGKTKEECGVSSEEEARQFYVETLANFARLMGSEGGRHLVYKLSEGNHQVSLKAGQQAECGVVGQNEFGKNLPQYEAKNLEKAGDRKGTGTPSEVHMVLGSKDSDKALRTRDGAALFGPRFVAMGHELIHALHNSRGVNRSGLGKGEEATADHKELVEEWDDMEEYWTIIKGHLSEQVLRDQYGLSAERFGHKSFDPKQPVADAYGEAVRVASEMAKRGPQVDEIVGARGFDPATLNAKSKLSIADADPELTGPLPAGWNANELTVKQMRGIIGKPIEYKLKQLGWSPFDLLEPLGEGDTIEAVTRDNRYHPRSPEGRRLSSKRTVT